LFLHFLSKQLEILSKRILKTSQRNSFLLLNKLFITLEEILNSGVIQLLSLNRLNHQISNNITQLIPPNTLHRGIHITLLFLLNTFLTTKSGRTTLGKLEHIILSTISLNFAISDFVTNGFIGLQFTILNLALQSVLERGVVANGETERGVGLTGVGHFADSQILVLIGVASGGPSAEFSVVSDFAVFFLSVETLGEGGVLEEVAVSGGKTELGVFGAVGFDGAVDGAAGEVGLVLAEGEGGFWFQEDFFAVLSAEVFVNGEGDDDFWAGSVIKFSLPFLFVEMVEG